MNNNLMIFNNPDFGAIRTLEMNGEPWFVGKDVAEVLGYVDTNKAIAMHIDEEDKLNDKTASSLGQRGGWLINESGLYSLIISSKLPTAKAFKRGVTSEVLPAIRKTGGYIPTTPEMSEMEILSRAVLIGQKTIERQKAQLEEQAPKVLFADSVAASKTSILVGALAKLLKQNGINIGPKRLFKWLRENGYLIKCKGSDWNMPTQKSMEQGLFEIKETIINNPDGSTRVTKTSKVTGKGQVYFVNKFLKKA